MEIKTRQEATTQPSNGKKGLLYVLMFVLTLVLLLGTGELLARFFVKLQSIPEPPLSRTIDPYTENPYIVQAHPYLYYHIPHSKYTQARSNYQVDYEINSMGFRGPEILPKGEGVKRLIVIGDSITEGHGNPFSKTFSYLLGENLHQHGWEVINMGTQGASPIYYAANVKRYLSVEPDAVLIVTFENELADDRVMELASATFPFLDNEEALLMKESTLSFLVKSRLYILLRRSWRYFVHSQVEEMIIQNRTVTYTPEEQQAIMAFDKQSPLKYLVAPAVLEKQWRMTQGYLDYAVSSFRQDDISVMIANFALVGPRFHELHRQYVSSLDEKMSHWAKTKELPFLSLLPIAYNAFGEHHHSKISIKDDGHPTSYTHALLERALQPWVIKNLNIK